MCLLATSGSMKPVFYCKLDTYRLTIDSLLILENFIQVLSSHCCVLAIKCIPCSTCSVNLWTCAPFVCCCFHFSANVPIHFIPSVFDHVPFKVGQSEISLFIQNNIQPLVSAASVNSPFVFFKLHGFIEKLVLPDKTFLFVLISLCLRVRNRNLCGSIS